MATIVKHSVDESYRVLLEETETIEILINGNSVFAQTVAVNNKAMVVFAIKEALAEEIA